MSGAAGQRGDNKAGGANADGERLRRAPFAGSAAALADLDRYSIASSRLIRLNDLGVPLQPKDCRRDGHGIA